MNQQQDGTTFRDSFNGVYVLAKCYECCLTPFGRTGFGVEYPGVFGLGAMVIILTVASFGTAPDDMIAFFVCWLVAVVVNRVRTWRDVSRSLREHSRFSGYPWLAQVLFPPAKTELQGKNVEPLLCFFIGELLSPLSEAVGGFVMAGMVPLLVTRMFEMMAAHRQVQQMHDAAIQQRQAAARYRGEWDEY